LNTIPPRFIRLKDAPHYLGMDRNRFNSLVRPSLICIPIGIQGIAFDRHDLDIWADNYKKHAGKSLQNSVNNEMIAFSPRTIPKKYLDSDFEKALMLSMKK